MKRYILVILLAASGLLNLTFAGIVAYGYLSGRSREVAPFNDFLGPPGPFRLKRFELPLERREEIEKIREEFRKERREARERIFSLREEIFEEVKKKDPDMDRIMNLIDKISDQQRILQKSVVRKVFGEREKLSPDERKLFDEKIKKRLMKRLWEGEEGHHGPGPCPEPCFRGNHDLDDDL